MAFVGLIDRAERLMDTFDQAHMGRVRAADSSISWVSVHSVSGFSHLREVVAREQQDELVRLIDIERRCWEGNDRLMRQYYGYRYHYENDSLSRVDDGALPQW